jgi:hypothetical protein
MIYMDINKGSLAGKKMRSAILDSYTGHWRGPLNPAVITCN